MLCSEASSSMRARTADAHVWAWIPRRFGLKGSVGYFPSKNVGEDVSYAGQHFLTMLPERVKAV